MEENLKKYHKICKYYNYAGVALAAAPIIIFFIFKPGLWLIKVSFIANWLYSFASFFLVKHSNEIIKFDEEKGSKYPSVFRGMIFGPALNAIWSAACVEQMLNYKRFLLMSFLLYAAFLLVVHFLDFEQLDFSGKGKNHKFSIISFYLLFAFCIVSSVPGINHYFSVSKNSESFSVTVTDKKGDEDIIVSPWLNSDKPKYINVSKSTFKKINTGDVLTIYVKKGLLGIDYFTYSL